MRTLLKLAVVLSSLAVVAAGLDSPSALAQESDFSGDFQEGMDDPFPSFDPDQEFGGPDEDAAAAMGLGVMCVFFAIGLVIYLAVWIPVSLILKGALQRIPQQYRQSEPGMAWLMLIPLVQLIMIFVLTSKLSQSFQSYFASKGRMDVGDCGKQLGLFWGIFAIICGPVGLVLMIMYLMKVSGLKNQIPVGATA